MTFAQYLRVEALLRSPDASPIAFVRAARTLLSAKGRAPEQRAFRKAWLRSGLEHRRKARLLNARIRKDHTHGLQGSSEAFRHPA